MPKEKKDISKEGRSSRREFDGKKYEDM